MKETLHQILEALMMISVRGNDVITLSNCLQTLNGVIQSMPDEEIKVEAVDPEIID